jgi:hypothetical protein
MRDLVGHDRQPSAYLVYLILYARAADAPHGRVTLSLREIAEATGLSKSVVQVSLRTLKRRQLVSATAPHRTATPTYCIWRPWIRPAQGARQVRGLQ